MKLLFAIKNLAGAAGGAERVLCMLCSELAGRGHVVTLVTFDRPGGRPFYPLDARVKRLDLDIGHAAQSARVRETLKRTRILRQLVRQEKPQVAIGFMHSMFIPLAFSLIGLSVPVIGSEHIVPEHYRRHPLQFALFLAAAPFMAKITVLSADIRMRYPFPIKDRMVPIPNPVMPAVNLASLSRSKERYQLLNVGRLDPQKDQRTLVQAFSRIAAAFPNWDLKIIGEGPLRAQLEHLVRDLGLSDRVSLPGVRSDMDAEYCAADLFALSSRYESFGLALAEAMGHGLPVMGFADCPGINELIDDDQTGLLVKPGQDRISSFAEGLAALMAEPGRRQRYGDVARQSINQKFSIKHAGDLWEQLLETAITSVQAKKVA